jgi:hypothetical protein
MVGLLQWVVVAWVLESGYKITRQSRAARQQGHANRKGVDSHAGYTATAKQTRKKQPHKAIDGDKRQNQSINRFLSPTSL